MNSEQSKYTAACYCRLSKDDLQDGIGGVNMINTDLINPVIKEKLYLCGWNENIRYDIVDAVGTLNKEGYHIFPYAEEVLRLFLNTEIIFDLKELKKIHAKRSRCYGEIRFNLLDTASGMYDSYGYLSSILNENVYPIGSVNNCLCLLVGESKRIYIDIKPVPKILGIDIVDFLNNIIAYKKFGIF
ncbi:MAG: SUKH-3 domain-containing protein [Treponema sp.]|uniref:SUKH-3 domain-containing protein n=1 Tax=Treponema sp. TaxID=166 RepID=UPI00298D7C6E|nr:SUKH-3 domain-containing protein [Treponema sp.]MCQ2602038.1 SUKH-3 domain-containing protein [Treponema sp.]